MNFSHPPSPFLLYLLVLFLLSVLPINGATQVLNDNYVLHLRLDYLTHAIAYLPWMFLAGRAFRPKQRKNRTMNFLILTMAGIACAVALEAIQLLLPYRAFNINDLAANLAGVIAGIPLYAQRRKRGEQVNG